MAREDWLLCSEPGLATRHAFPQPIISSALLSSPDKQSIFDVQQEDANPHMEPLRSSKLHKGWIANVQLLLGIGEQERSGMPMLLSASNDGSVCLWDLQKVSADGTPNCLSRSNPHAGLLSELSSSFAIKATPPVQTTA